MSPDKIFEVRIDALNRLGYKIKVKPVGGSSGDEFEVENGIFNGEIYKTNTKGILEVEIEHDPVRGPHFQKDEVKEEVGYMLWEFVVVGTPDNLPKRVRIEYIRCDNMNYSCTSEGRWGLLMAYNSIISIFEDPPTNVEVGVNDI
jgi:hypothetical protein